MKETVKVPVCQSASEGGGNKCNLIQYVGPSSLFLSFFLVSIARWRNGIVGSGYYFSTCYEASLYQLDGDTEGSTSTRAE